MATSNVSNPLHKKGATSWKETKRGILPRHDLIRFEVEGAARGLAHVLKIASRRKLVFSTKLLVNLHARCFASLFEWAGRYRRMNVQVSNHVPPQWYEVPVLMHNFVEDLNVRLAHVTMAEREREQHIKDVIELVVWSQHRFLWIHPFQDYNGRIARLLSSLILSHFRLPLLQIELSDTTIRKRYIRALQKADEYDYSELTKVIAEMLGV